LQRKADFLKGREKMKKQMLFVLLLMLTVVGLWAQTGGVCAELSGSDAWLDMGNRYKYSGDFTTEMWVYKDDWNVSSDETIISCTHLGGYNIRIDDNGADDRIMFEYRATGDASYHQITYPITGNIEPGWHHIAVTHTNSTSSSSSFLYVDGNAAAGYGSDMTGFDSDNHMILGAEAGTGSSPDAGYFDGQIDEVRLWNRALSSTELDEWRHKNITASDFPSYHANLRGYFTFDASWSWLDDLSGNVSSAHSNDNDMINYNASAVYSNAPVGSLPSVMTNNVSDITDISATGGGDISYTGASPVTISGVCWNTTGNPVTADYLTTDGTDFGSFVSTLSGLSNNTTYYVRAYATNSSGTGYGYEEISTTLDYITTPPATGDGTSGNPYRIATLANLYWLSQNSGEWDKYYIQTADIDATATSDWNSGEGFSPIGNLNTTSFTGTYDGQGYLIDGLFINRPGSRYQGLFGSANNAQIQNIGITNANVTGDDYVGGLIGYSSSSSVDNCYSTGSVTGTNSNTGGLVGYSHSSSVENCYSTGNVTGTYRVGGLIGYNYSSSSVADSYSMGIVTGTGNYVGGLVGDNANSSTVDNCYNKGSVSGINNVGGLVGHNSSSTVDNCYSTGSVTGGSDSGGLIGYNYYYYYSVDNSFWDTETSGTTTGVGSGSTTGVTGKTTTEMQTMSTFSDAGWDFTTPVWGMGASLNEGYPYLSWQNFTDFPGGQGTDVGGATTITPSADLDNAADQTIPPIPNAGFATGYQAVFTGAGIVSISISTPFQFGAFYQDGNWHSRRNNGGIILFENIDFDARGDVPVILGDENPLPVTLSSFTAVFSNGSSLLAWTTQSESNNLGWNVYRSETESISESISESTQANSDMIEGAGTSSEQTDYVFIDQDETYPNTSYWYWIESVDLGGNTNLHGPAQVDIPEEVVPELPAISALSGNYPNPFNPTTSIKFDIKENETGIFSIFNVKGQIIVRESFEAGNHIYNWNATRFASGVYFYRLQTPSFTKVNKMLMLK
jgi:hypothetical protein